MQEEKLIELINSGNIFDSLPSTEDFEFCLKYLVRINNTEKLKLVLKTGLVSKNYNFLTAYFKYLQNNMGILLDYADEILRINKTRIIFTNEDICSIDQEYELTYIYAYLTGYNMQVDVNGLSADINTFIQGIISFAIDIDQGCALQYKKTINNCEHIATYCKTGIC